MATLDEIKAVLLAKLEEAAKSDNKAVAEALLAQMRNGKLPQSLDKAAKAFESIHGEVVLERIESMEAHRIVDSVSTAMNEVLNPPKRSARNR